MFLRSHARAVAGAVLLAVSVLAGPALGAAGDYRFELVQTQPAGPGKTLVTVRLLHTTGAKPVAGAVLFESKADMAPDGMADMAGKVTPQSSDQPGLYRFLVETGMAGKWRVALAAKVQGETDTVRGSVPFEAK